MRDEDAVHHRSTRVYAVILTRNRPSVLERCVDTALTTLGAEDSLTVLDDSCAAISRANTAVLVDAARRSITPLIHLQAEPLHDTLARAVGGTRALWHAKTAPRDIAPLRNLSLLISATVDARTTVLVDDDMCGFDLDVTHHLLDTLEPAPDGLVVGAAICGTTEQDTITRLSDAMGRWKMLARGTAVSIEEFFRATPGDKRGTNERRWVSAGYVAFRLPAARLFAFPPGYNEDWLWSLLHGAGGETRVVQGDQAVEHEPPTLRRSTRDDILFELAGDLVFDCLLEQLDRRPRGPESVLEDLAQHTPDTSVMPSVRVEALLGQARVLSENRHWQAPVTLESYGLGVLRGLLWSGQLEMDGNTMLNAWSEDAAAKHRSFATTLHATTVWRALREAQKEGRL